MNKRILFFSFLFTFIFASFAYAAEPDLTSMSDSELQEYMRDNYFHTDVTISNFDKNADIVKKLNDYDHYICIDSFTNNPDYYSDSKVWFRNYLIGFSLKTEFKNKYTLSLYISNYYDDNAYLNSVCLFDNTSNDYYYVTISDFLDKYCEWSCINGFNGFTEFRCYTSEFNILIDSSKNILKSEKYTNYICSSNPIRVITQGNRLDSSEYYKGSEELAYLIYSEEEIKLKQNFNNWVRSDLPIFGVYSYCQQYGEGSMTDDFLMKAVLNRSDFISVPLICKDGQVAEIKEFKTYVGREREYFNVNWYIGDYINDYTGFYGKIYMEYKNQNGDVLGSWGDDFEVHDLSALFYGVMLKDTVLKYNLEWDGLSYNTISGYLVVQPIEVFNNVACEFGKKYTINFNIDNRFTKINVKQTDININNGDEGSTSDVTSDKTDGSQGNNDVSGSGGGNNSGSGGVSGGGSSSETPGGSSSLFGSMFDGLSGAINLVGSIPAFIGQLFPMLPSELVSLMLLGIIGGIGISLYKLLVH